MEKLLIICFASWVMVSCSSLVEMNAKNDDEIYSPEKSKEPISQSENVSDSKADSLTSYRSYSPYESQDTAKPMMLGRKYASVDTTYSGNGYDYNNDYSYNNPRYYDDYYYSKQLLGFRYSPLNYYGSCYDDCWPYYSYNDWYWGHGYYYPHYNWGVYWSMPVVYHHYNYYNDFYPKYYSYRQRVNRGEGAQRRMSFNDGYSNHYRNNYNRDASYAGTRQYGYNNGRNRAYQNSKTGSRTKSDGYAIAQNQSPQGNQNGTIYYPPSSDNERRPSSSSSETYQNPQRQRSQWNERGRPVPERNRQESQPQQERQRAKQYDGNESQSSDSYRRPASSGTNSWGGTSNYRGGSSNDGYGRGSGTGYGGGQGGNARPSDRRR